MDSYFGYLNPRTAKIRARLIHTRPSVCVERAVITTDVYKEREQDQIVIKRARMLESVLKNMSVYIDPDGILVYLRTNSDLCRLQHKLIGFYNRAGWSTSSTALKSATATYLP